MFICHWTNLSPSDQRVVLFSLSQQHSFSCTVRLASSTEPCSDHKGEYIAQLSYRKQFHELRTASGVISKYHDLFNSYACIGDARLENVEIFIIYGSFLRGTSYILGKISGNVLFIFSCTHALSTYLDAMRLSKIWNKGENLYKGAAQWYTDPHITYLWLRVPGFSVHDFQTRP